MSRISRTSFASLLASAAFAAAAQTAGIPAPDHWRRERFDFPLPFAPAIALEGVEHVRFAPGWADFASGQGFSYVLLWDVKTPPAIALQPFGLENAINAYFDGLMFGVAAARKVDYGPRTVSSLHPMRIPSGWEHAHAGTIHTWNAFSKGEPIALELELTRRECPGSRTQLFFAISQAKRDQAVWDPLRKARDGAKCG